MKEKKFKSALQVNEGVEQPPSINPSLKNIKKKKRLSITDYVDGILNGNISILSQAITLVESSLTNDHDLAQEIIEKCLPHSGNSLRVGITGVPGVGKSTFIEALGRKITGSGRKLAVLAIDPSSERTKGSILGDKTRMEDLSVDKNAFIRPSPSAGSLGGVARKTRESIILCEAAGFNTIFIETVGVGQSETAVHSMTDFFLLLMLAGAGDELQGIKRGIMEMADAIAITKADDSNIKKATRAKAEYQNALHLFPLAESNWSPKVLTCSALTNDGIWSVWETILEFEKLTKENKYFMMKRNEQSTYWMHQSIQESLKSSFYTNENIKRKVKQMEQEVLKNKISSFVAAKDLLEEYFNNY